MDQKPKCSIKRVDQSPMNPLRWCIEFDCGQTKTLPEWAEQLKE